MSDTRRDYGRGTSCRCDQKTRFYRYPDLLETEEEEEQ